MSPGSGLTSPRRRRRHDPPAARQFDDLEIGPSGPRVEFDLDEEATARSRQPAVWNRARPREFMNGSCRAPKALRNLFDDEEWRRYASDTAVA
jgi:hypothetical protein